MKTKEIVYYHTKDGESKAYSFEPLDDEQLARCLFGKGEVAKWMGFSKDPRSALRSQERYLKQTPALMALLQRHGYRISAKKMSGYCAHIINEWFCGAGNDHLIQIGIDKTTKGLLE